MGALDDAGAPDADSDTDSDTDLDSDTDADTDDAGSQVIDEACDGVPEPAVVLGGEPDDWPDIDLDRFIDLAAALYVEFAGGHIAVLSEYELLPDEWIPTLLIFDLDSNALAGHPDMVIATGEGEFAPEERPVKLVDRLPHDIGQSVAFPVLFRHEEDGHAVIGAVLTPPEDPLSISRIADDPFEPAGHAVHGICGFDESLVAYGAGIWISDDLVEWQHIDEIGPFPAFNEMASNGGGSTRAVAVGLEGRVLLADAPDEWLEPEPGTGNDLYAVALVPDSNGPPFDELAGGEGGLVLSPATGNSWACALADADVTAATWVSGGLDQAWIGTADGTLLRVDSSAAGCVAAELDEPVLALELGWAGFCQYILALTETKLYAVEAYCMD